MSAQILYSLLYGPKKDPDSKWMPHDFLSPSVSSAWLCDKKSTHALLQFPRLSCQVIVESGGGSGRMQGNYSKQHLCI